MEQSAAPVVNVPAELTQPQGGAQPSQGQPQQPPEQALSDWRQSLPEQMRNDPSLKNFKSIADLAAGYINTKKVLSQRPGQDPDRVYVPNENSTPEETENFLRSIGVPEQPDGYEIPAPPQGFEYNQDMLNWFKHAAHQNGMTGKQFEGIIQAHQEYMMQSMRDIHAFYGSPEAFQRACDNANRALRELPKNKQELVINCQDPVALLILDHFGASLGEGQAPPPAWRSAPSSYGGGMGRVAEIDAELRNPKTPPSVKKSLMSEKREILQSLR